MKTIGRIVYIANIIIYIYWIIFYSAFNIVPDKSIIILAFLTLIVFYSIVLINTFED